MICAVFFLLADLPPLEPDFKELEEFIVLEETYDQFVGEHLIGSKEWIPFVLNKNPRNKPERVEHDFQILFERYAKAGSTVLDYGAGCGGSTLLLSRFVGVDGKVLAFEPNQERFRALFWNLLNSNVQQANIFYPEKEKDLDDYEFENLSLIRIDAGGREDLILEGAEKTIRQYKPVLLLNILGGVSLERSDRFLKREFDRRMEMIRKLGYTSQRINDTWYLALPKMQ